MNPTATSIQEIWVYLSGNPLFALILTLSAYWVGLWIYERSGHAPVANPVAIAVLLIVVCLLAVDLPYATYFEGAQFVHFLLGTATVSLAVPIYKGLQAMRKYWLAILVALVAGATTSIVVAVGIGWAFGLEATLLSPLLAKSVTAPIAMGVAKSIGASPTLTAVYAVCSGIIGAVLGAYVLNAIGVKSWWQRGFAIGVGAHGIGTSRAFSVNQEAGAFASLAMGLHGIAGALGIPLVMRWV
jgi:putative effector of murein hydrolase